MIEYAFKTICRFEEPSESDPLNVVSCDVVNNCHPFANCEFDANSERYQCVCGSGFDGNGIDCIEVEANCAHEDICDVHAECVYNATQRKNICVCQVRRCN